jgi:putative transposase
MIGYRSKRCNSLYIVIHVLNKLMRTHGMPRYLRSDNGPEFVSKALIAWGPKESLQLALIDPGKTW